ncbi:hypothetical protein ACS0TY_032655 [Phlomoides rotata]
MGEGDAILCCCAVFVGVLLLTAIPMIILAVKSYTPHCYLHDLYIPALNTKLPTTSNTSAFAAAATFIFFDVKLQNGITSDSVRFRYSNSTLAFYYASKTIANYTVARFSQGKEETTHLHDVVETLGMPWRDALAAVSGGSTAAFTVELATTVKVRREFGRSGHKVLLLRADVNVNGSGERVRNKAIRLVAK